MKVKIKLKICEFNELLSVATAYTKDKFFIKQWSNIQKLNLRAFIYFGLKKQIDWSVNNEMRHNVKTLKIDVNQFEALKHVFNLEREKIGTYASAIFFGIYKQVNTQVEQKIILLSNYE